MQNNEYFEICNENYRYLSGKLSDGCLHLKSEVWGDDYDSEKHYDLSREETDILFRAMSLDDFLDECAKEGLEWMEDFFKDIGINPRTVCI